MIPQYARVRAQIPSPTSSAKPTWRMLLCIRPFHRVEPEKHARDQGISQNGASPVADPRQRDACERQDLEDSPKDQERLHTDDGCQSGRKQLTVSIGQAQ